MIDPASFGYGIFAGIAFLGAAEWALYHYWPVDRTRDARDLAREHRKHPKY
jgi:hypothetical protein